MIDKIFHVSDIHIRLYRRSKQYKQVLNNLIDKINKLKTQNSIIVLTGDILHSKTEMSPESIVMADLFLSSLAEVLPTIVIAGNHDANLANKNRLDSLTPIIELIDNQNLIYYRDTGWYNYENIDFWVASVFDERMPDLFQDNENYKILLYHGAVNNVQVNGIKMSSNFSTSDFVGFNYVLLGDIHKSQILSQDPLTAYAGSLMQLNFGEEVDNHGMLVWDLGKGKATHVPIENEYRYYNIIIENGQIVDMPEIITKHPRIKLKYSNTDFNVLKQIQSDINKKYNVEQMVLYKQDTGLQIKSSTFEFDLQNIDDVRYQETIIKDYIKHADITINSKDLDNILELNKTINKQYKSKNIPNSQNYWTIQKLQFNNFFGFGQGNEINFSNHKGIVGIVGQNRVGKSSIINCILFMLYDKTACSFKSMSVLNNKKKQLWGKITLSINHRLYYIERWGKLNKKGTSLPIKCKFYTINDAGEQIDLSGTQRSDTNNIIQSYIGQMEDATSTFISSQGNSNSFIQMSNANRKTQLNSLLNLSIFDECHNWANQSAKGVKGYLSNIDIQNIQNNIQKYNVENKEIKKSSKKLQSNLKTIESDIDTKEKELRKVLQRQKTQIYTDTDIEQIQDTIKRVGTSLAELVNKKVQLESNKQNIHEQIQDMQLYINQIDIANLREKARKLHKYVSQNLMLNSDLKSLNSTIKEQNKKVKLLQDVEYDQDCEFCMSNPLTIDAIESKNGLERLQAEKLSLEVGIQSISKYVAQYEELHGQIQLYDKQLMVLYNSLLRQMSTINQNYSDILFKIEQHTTKLKDYLLRESTYHQNQKIIEQNIEIRTTIESLQVQASILKKNKKQIDKQILQGKIKLTSNNQYIKHNDTVIEEYNERDYYLSLLEKYKSIMGRTGLQYYITSNIITVLESEMNSILQMLTNFSIQFVMDGKSIDINIVYPDKKYLVETCSGFEKFVISIAIRHSLSTITNKSKAKMFIIDEGFGVLDNENVMQFKKIFDFISEKYETLLVISHLDVMKDMFQDRIQIQYKNGVSKII